MFHIFYLLIVISSPIVLQRTLSHQ